jgi:hypothetical protein
VFFPILTLLLTSFAVASSPDDVATVSHRCTRGELTACEALKEIAMRDGDWLVRLAAVTQLNDQVTLADIATKDDNWHVRNAAVNKVTNTTVLAKVAAEDKNPNVVAAANNTLKISVSELTARADNMADVTRNRDASIARIRCGSGFH